MGLTDARTDHSIAAMLGERSTSAGATTVTWRAQGVTVPRSLLLTGPPGTGKTQIARTLANESGLGFLAATTADVKANFLGQSGNRVKQFFERARANAPVILFLDELDIIAPARMGGNDPLTDEIVGQLLQELDGIQSRDSEVFLLAGHQSCRADRSRRAVPVSGAAGDSTSGPTWTGAAAHCVASEKAAYLRTGRGQPHPGRHERGYGDERTGPEKLDRPRRTEGTAARHRHRWTAAFRSDPG
jgi:DNA polymerase III delta prime subunit